VDAADQSCDGIGVHNSGQQRSGIPLSLENEQYQKRTLELFTGGNHGEVTRQRGKHLFYTYVLTPPEAQAPQK